VDDAVNIQEYQVDFALGENVAHTLDARTREDHGALEVPNNQQDSATQEVVALAQNTAPFETAFDPLPQETMALDIATNQATLNADLIHHTHQNETGKTVLIVTCMQNDYLEGGSIGVQNSLDILPVINAMVQNPAIDSVVWSRDWHPTSHVSFAENHEGAQPYT